MSEEDFDKNTGWATLRFPFSKMTEEERECLIRAEDYLERAGVIFDTSSGENERGEIDRQWNLDWSLVGAVVKTKPLRCMYNHCRKIIEGEPVIDLKSYGSGSNADNYRMTQQFVFCSHECKKNKEEDDSYNVVEE